MSKCLVRQESDEMVCACGKRWDVNDPEPPQCDQDPNRLTGAAFAQDRRRQVARPEGAKVHAEIPLNLPRDLALKMAVASTTTFEEARLHHGPEECYVQAIRAAYRVLLDSL